MGKMGDKKLGFFENFMLAGVAAGVSKTVAAPIERVKLLVQNQDEMIKQGRLDRPYKGVMDCCSRVMQTEGIYPFWRGNLAISAVGIFIYRGMYFGMFDTLKPLLLGDNPNVGLSFLLGWAVTVTAGLMSYPIYTVRRRMMMTSGGGVKYKGSMDCFIQVTKNEGFMSLMKGAGANILRGVAGAGVLAGFDKFQAMYIAWRTANA